MMRAELILGAIIGVLSFILSLKSLKSAYDPDVDYSGGNRLEAAFNSLLSLLLSLSTIIVCVVEFIIKY